MMKKTSAKTVLLLFIALSMLLRFPSFFPTVISHDESTYLAISWSMLNGSMLYVDVIDIKPAGIFLIFSALQTIFGNTIIPFRMFGAVVVALTAFFLTLTQLKLKFSQRVAVNTGFIYIFFTSIWAFYGLSINTEIYFNLFTAIMLYCIVAAQQRVWLLFVAGLAGGIGFIIKYVVLFDFAAIAFVFVFLNVLHLQPQQQTNYQQRILKLLPAAAGFAIPFLSVAAFYYFNGYFSAFSEISFEAPGKYALSYTFWQRIKPFIDFMLRFMPIFFFIFYTFFTRIRKKDNVLKIFIIIWISADIIGIGLMGVFMHYLVQLIIPLSFIAGYFFAPERKIPAFIKKITTRPVNIYVLIGIVVISLYFQTKEFILTQDYPKKVALYVEELTTEGDTIYTSNYHQVIYYLTDTRCPTKYLHRSLLYDSKHINALRIDTLKAINRIINSNPACIIYEKEIPSATLKKHIETHYKTDTVFNQTIFVLKPFKKN